MITTDVRDLHEQLSRYIALVKKGEEVIVTEHGTIVARIVHTTHSSQPLRQELLPLLQKGQITYPSQAINRDFPEPVKLPGKPVSEMVLEDRR
jgi:antitoxin (DNA-binding transcriptional repressor) of toxin-antitoxin stability system